MIFAVLLLGYAIVLHALVPYASESIRAALLLACVTALPVFGVLAALDA